MNVVILSLLLLVAAIAMGSLVRSVARGTFLWQNQTLADRYFGGGWGYQSVMFWVSLCLIFGFLLGAIVVIIRLLVMWYTG